MRLATASLIAIGDIEPSADNSHVLIGFDPIREFVNDAAAHLMWTIKDIQGQIIANQGFRNYDESQAFADATAQHPLTWPELTSFIATWFQIHDAEFRGRSAAATDDSPELIIGNDDSSQWEIIRMISRFSSELLRIFMMFRSGRSLILTITTAYRRRPGIRRPVF